MGKLRSVSTSFWSDPFVEDLTPVQKLLFLYLITNEKTNMLGIYELSIKKISFETDINKNEIEKGLKAFERVGKVKYIDNYVILVNYMKHQNFNTNMKKSAIDTYNSLPNVLKDSTINISKAYPSEGFESLLNHYGMVSKVEVEYEVEEEEETKIAFESFWDLYDKKVGDKTKLIKKWNIFTSESQELILQFIPKYKLANPNKKFRKDPSTFFNNKSWLDEIIGEEAIKIKPPTDQPWIEWQWTNESKKQGWYWDTKLGTQWKPENA